MTASKPRIASNTIGIAALACTLVSASWLLVTYLRATYTAPRDKAVVAALKEKARTDTEVQKVLQPELDRQRDAAVARRWKYQRGSVLLLVSSLGLVAWIRWLRPASADRKEAGARATGPAKAASPASVQHSPRQVVGERPSVDLAAVDEILRMEGTGRESTIPILQAIQARYRYLPNEALQRVRDATGIPASQLAGVATFYGQFRHEPIGEHIIRVCEGTACHVAGAVEVENELRRRLGIPEGSDTDAAGQYTIERVACLGSCSLAPVITIDEKIYGHVSALSAGGVVREFEEAAGQPPKRAARKHASSAEDDRADADGGVERVEIRVGLGSCGIASGAEPVHAAVQDEAAESGDGATVKAVGCRGLCHQEPLVEVLHRGQRTFYGRVAPQDVRKILRTHVRPKGLAARIRSDVREARLRLLDDSAWARVEERRIDPAPYLGKQVRIVLENCGEIHPLSFDEYRKREGMRALEECLKRTAPESVIEQIRASGLRGRGGAGFPTARKWELTRKAPPGTKYVICNGDEGDPGAFMDRAVLEADPFRVIEGLMIAAYAVGASEGFFYVRREYPVAVRHIRAAIETLEREGYLGHNILGSDFSFRVQVREGAGAFVCGEETALIQSIEGERGMPRLRPPFPAQSGLHGRPTLINNVETLACVPWILRHGAPAFAALGSGTSRGTKVFSLAGKVNRGGLIEVPMGITIREIVEDIGGGMKDGRPFKAVLIGGPSGGCIPASLADTRVDYEELASTGSIMGSGGLVVLDNRDCAVEIARYFLQFTQSESCGKCTFCRIGTRRMLEILERICAGKGRESDIRTLEDLGNQIRRGSLCGLGQTAPNPVLTTLRYFREEYEAHVREKRCPAGQCRALIHFSILESCTGCTLCAQACPAAAITSRPYERHVVIDDLCTRCGMCVMACPENAVEVA